MTPEDLIQTYEQALASQQWSQVQPLMHEAVCVTFLSGTFKGKDQVKQAFEHNFKQIKDETYLISNRHWIQTHSTTAVCLYHFKWSGIINGKLCSGGGRGTSVLIYESDRWQILTEHLGPHAQ